MTKRRDWAGRVRLVALLGGIMAACGTSPKGRVTAGLADLGMAPAMAECVAGEMNDRLSRRQMQTLADILDETSTARASDRLPLTALDIVLDSRDPQMASAAARAGAACTILEAP